MNALLTAAQNGDTEEVSRIWRELPPGEQESVLLTLLQTQVGTASDEASPESDEGLDPSSRGPGGPMNTHTIAIAALVIAILLVLVLFVF